MAQYRIPVEETFSWQRPVISALLNDPPVSPAKGDRYIVGAGTGDWTGQDQNIAWYDGSTWKFDTRGYGWIAYVKDLDVYYRTSAAGFWEEYELHTHDNKAILDLIEEPLTTALKAVYDDAVDKTHEHPNKAVLDVIEAALTNALKASYDDAVDKAHAHANKAVLDDITAAFTTALKDKLDGIESGAVSLSTVKDDVDIADAIDKKHSHSNKAILDDIEAALTSALKVNYDEAYSRRGTWDSDLGCIIMDI